MSRIKIVVRMANGMHRVNTFDTYKVVEAPKNDFCLLRNTILKSGGINNRDHVRISDIEP